MSNRRKVEDRIVDREKIRVGDVIVAVNEPNRGPDHFDPFGYVFQVVKVAVLAGTVHEIEATSPELRGTRSIMLASHYWVRHRSVEEDGRFPHRCPRCGGPSYINGMDVAEHPEGARCR